MADANPLFGYGQRADGKAYATSLQHDSLQSVVQQDSHQQYSFQRTDTRPVVSLQPTTSSRFSVIASSESASESRFSPFSRSGSQHALPKVGLTVTAASSLASVQTVLTSSSGKSLQEGKGREGDGREVGITAHTRGFSTSPDDMQVDSERLSATPEAMKPFSPFTQPHLFAEQALHARHSSAKKTVLRPTRSVSPIGHGRPQPPLEDADPKHPKQETPPSPAVVGSEENAAYATEESYVYALGSLLQDVQL